MNGTDIFLFNIMTKQKKYTSKCLNVVMRMQKDFRYEDDDKHIKYHICAM